MISLSCRVRRKTHISALTPSHLMSSVSGDPRHGKHYPRHQIRLIDLPGTTSRWADWYAVPDRLMDMRDCGYQDDGDDATHPSLTPVA